MDVFIYQEAHRGLSIPNFTGVSLHRCDWRNYGLCVELNLQPPPLPRGWLAQSPNPLLTRSGLPSMAGPRASPLVSINSDAIRDPPWMIKNHSGHSKDLVFASEEEPGTRIRQTEFYNTWWQGPLGRHYKNTKFNFQGLLSNSNHDMKIWIIHDKQTEDYQRQRDERHRRKEEQEIYSLLLAYF